MKTDYKSNDKIETLTLRQLGWGPSDIYQPERHDSFFSGTGGHPFEAFPVTLSEGWRTEEPAVVTLIGPRKMASGDLHDGDQVRADIAASVATMVAELKTTKEVTVALKSDGKPITELGSVLADRVTDLLSEYSPQYRGVMCYRRSYALMISALLWADRLSVAAQPATEADGDIEATEAVEAVIVDPLDYPIACIVREYSDDIDEAYKQECADRWQENNLKGRSEYSFAGRYLQACEAVNSQCMTEAQLMRSLGVARGTGQRLHKLATLTGKFSSLNWRERCMKPRPTVEDGKPAYQGRKGFADVAKCQSTGLTTLIGGSGITSPDETAKQAIADETGAAYEKGQSARINAVEGYLELVTNGVKNAPKVLKGESIRAKRTAMADDHPASPILQAILDNKAEGLATACQTVGEMSATIEKLSAELQEAKNKIAILEAAAKVPTPKPAAKRTRK